MTFEQFAAVVRDWQSRLTPEQARARVESLLPMDVVAALTRTSKQVTVVCWATHRKNSARLAQDAESPDLQKPAR
jgi:hypothetical protein